MSPRGDAPEDELTVSRRSLLRAVGGATSLSFVGGASAHARQRPTADGDADGLADADEGDSELERRIAGVFGDQFEGFEQGRRDLLFDVRYVEGVAISPETKRRIERLFRREGIYAQWLDYPTTYDAAAFERRYGSNARAVLWGGDSFYHEEVKRFLRDVAIQLVVIPGREHPDYEGLIYSPWTDALGGGRDGHVNGFSVGNRAVVAERESPGEEQRLVLHELAHLALCHADDPDNKGVMGTGEKVDLTAREWERLRRNLDNVSDATGYDVLFRPCLWKECLGDLADRNW